jgi:hypothetical protein
LIAGSELFIDEDTMSSQPQYEFDDKQNDIIENLSRSMLWIAAPSK